MADKRMFNKKVTKSDAFLDMPISTQNLYFHLNMDADDDGFVNNPKQIVTLVKASIDDLKLLIAKRFVIGFESGVIVIKHWRMHNTLRKDRYHPTDYQEEFSMLGIKSNGVYTEAENLLPYTSNESCKSNGNHLATTWQPSIDKIRLDKNSNSNNILNNAREILIDSFTQELTRPLTPIEMQLIFEWEKDYSADLILLALKEAVIKGKRSFKYIEAILISWKNRGIRTVIEAQQAIDEFNYHKSMMNADEDAIDELMLKDVSDLEKKRGRMFELESLMELHGYKGAKYEEYMKEYEALAKELDDDNNRKI